ncbi:hypothetical protein NN561_008193 [Cricetulus griseus]
MPPQVRDESKRGGAAQAAATLRKESAWSPSTGSRKARSILGKVDPAPWLLPRQPEASRKGSELSRGRWLLAVYFASFFRI